MSKLELEVYARIPRRDTQVTLYDNGEGLAQRAAERLVALGYTQVSLLEGGLDGWRRAGGELFIDVNVPSKAFGELVENQRHTPSLAAEEVQALLDSQADVVVLDARRFDEYQTMSIPTGISVPGPSWCCAPVSWRPIRPRASSSIAPGALAALSAQSLINAGLPNPVAALRNGTIGWTLAGQTLAHGQARRFAPTSENHRQLAAQEARGVADKASVKRATLNDLQRWQQDATRTTYLFDVRTVEEFEAGHLPGARATRAGNWCRKPTTLPVCAVRAWYWWMTTACAPICPRHGWPNWAGRCTYWMTCKRSTSASAGHGSRQSRNRPRPN